MLALFLLSASGGPRRLHAQEQAEQDEQEDLSQITPRPASVPPESVPPGSGPVTATPGMSFKKSGIYRFFFGDLNRDLWDIPFEVEVLDLAKEAGGLTPSELSGGKQTLGLRFDGADGRIYQFRSIVKDATRGIPGILRIDPVSSIVQDQSSAQFPLGALVVSEFLEAAGVLVATPRPVIMPDDPRLGKYRELFAGRMGWIEERPNELEDGGAAFAGSSKITGTEALYENLEEDPRNYVDVVGYLKARLIDMFVGDWDRHFNQWRWASFDDDDLVRWEPIPRDRDWALNRIDGLIVRWAGLYYPQYRGFSAEYPSPFNYHFSAQFLDRRLLSALPREAFVETAEELQAEFDDATIERAVGVLPPGYREAVGDQLVSELKQRRDGLRAQAIEYYDLLARWVDVTATDADDVATITGLPDGFVRLEIESRYEGRTIPKFSRTFDPAETDEIRLYMQGGEDEVRIFGEDIDDIRLRLVGNKGDDEFLDETSGKNVKVYDDDGDNRYELGGRGSVNETEHDDPDEMQHLALIWQTRDWGNAWTVLPRFSYDTDVGAFIGATITRYGFGFRHDPYRTFAQLRAEVGPSFDRSRGGLDVMRTLNDDGLQFGLHGQWMTGPTTRFFGVGNETTGDADDDFYLANRGIIELGLRLASHPDHPLALHAGPVVVLAGGVESQGTVFEGTDLYGAGEFSQLGAAAGAHYRSVDNPSFPTSGGTLRMDGRVFPSVLDVQEAFGSGKIEARYYLAAPDVPFAPALHLRSGGQKVWGAAPFYELAYLGDAGLLPGYRPNRFAGQEAVSASALGRIKLFTFSPFGELDVGVHGIASTGRVWVDGEDSDEWHNGFGGGLWILPPAFGKPLSVSLVRGEDETRTYVRLGFPF
jgi:hypothetical protein